MKNKVLGFLLAALAFTIPAFAQNIQPQNASPLHRVASVFNAPAYTTWTASIINGNSSTGSGTSITVATNSSGVLLGDGTILPMATVFNTATPIFVNDANSETVTPTGVTIGACPAGNVGVGSSTLCATITGNFANTHGASAQVISGDSGIEEAVTDAQNSGGGQVYFEINCGLVTLSTSGATTTTTCNIPATYVAMGGSVHVTTTITTSASYSVGTASNTTKFISACTALTAGTNCYGFTTSPTVSTGTSVALTALLVTANATAGAGVIHLKVWGYVQAQSAS
jgi:hypothetical protein